MAEEFESNEDRTEDATPERREEFREKGQVAVSREVTSVIVLASSIIFLTFYAPFFMRGIQQFLTVSFETSTQIRLDPANFSGYLLRIGGQLLLIIAPFFLVTSMTATLATFAQTRFNFSWKRLKPDFARMNPLKGVVRMANLQAAMELFKGVGKMLAVGGVSYLILKSEWSQTPGLMTLPIAGSFAYWADITSNLFWVVCILLLVIGGADYLYNFISLERKLRMTKKEVKEEYKRREVDPLVKGRIRRMQRDLANRRMVERTKDATVVITNPTHYSIALRYEIGMSAPVVIAKGVDFLALQMREAAAEADIPIVENRPLARALYKVVEIGQEIPETLYKAVSEIIRYVFRLKGINYRRAEAGVS